MQRSGFIGLFILSLLATSSIAQHSGFIDLAHKVNNLNEKNYTAVGDLIELEAMGTVTADQNQGFTFSVNIDVRIFRLHPATILGNLQPYYYTSYKLWYTEFPSLETRILDLEFDAFTLANGGQGGLGN